MVTLQTISTHCDINKDTKVAKQVTYTQSVEEFLNVSFQSNAKTRARSTNIFSCNLPLGEIWQNILFH